MRLGERRTNRCVVIFVNLVSQSVCMAHFTVPLVPAFSCPLSPPFLSLLPSPPPPLSHSLPPSFPLSLSLLPSPLPLSLTLSLPPSPLSLYNYISLTEIRSGSLCNVNYGVYIMSRPCLITERMSPMCIHCQWFDVIELYTYAIILLTSCYYTSFGGVCL